jgi:hypothetical protein
LSSAGAWTCSPTTVAGRLITGFRTLGRPSPPTLPPCCASTPAAPGLGALVGELSIQRPEFRRHWSDQRVHQRTTGTKGYHHPLVGDLTVTYQALTPGDDAEQILFVYRTEPGSASENALRLLTAGEAGSPATNRAESYPS